MTIDSDASKENVAALIEQIVISFKPQFYEETRLMELTMQQFRTLVLLFNEGPMRMSSISSQLGIGMPAVTSVVGKLEDKGLVTREHNNEDRRVVLCYATQRGINEVKSFWSVRKEEINTIVAALSDEDEKLVARASNVMLRVIKDSQKAKLYQTQVV